MLSDGRAKWEPREEIKVRGKPVPWTPWLSEGKTEPLTILLTRGKVLLRCRPTVLRACGYSLLSGRANVLNP